jgi:spore coat polysaccharide biosynthesis protein SpsF
MRDEWNDQVIADVCDLLIFQSILKPYKPNDKIISGVEYIMINKSYAELQPDFDGPIVVSLGGSDPHGLTPQIVGALEGLHRRIKVVIGQAFDYSGELGDVVEVYHQVNGLQDFLNGASLLIGALGMTAYEAAAAGVPALLFSWSPDHEQTASELERRGVCFNLGMWDEFDPGDLRLHVEGLSGNKNLWLKMSAAGKALVDGRGVERVADRIMELIFSQEE